MALTEEFFQRLAKSLGDAIHGGEGDEEAKKAAAEKEAADKAAADKVTAEAKVKADADAETARKAKEEADKAAAQQVPEATQKALDAISVRIGALEKTLTSEDDGSLRHVITALAAEVENTREALSKGLDTLKAVVDSTVVKKSLAGDDRGGDGDGDGNAEQDKTKLEKRASDEFEHGVLEMLKSGKPLLLK